MVQVFPCLNTSLQVNILKPFTSVQEHVTFTSILCNTAYNRFPYTENKEIHLEAVS